MKNIYYLIIIISIAFISCSEDELDTLDISDFSVHVAGQAQETAGNVVIDRYLTFLDISQNPIDHQWVIEDGNFFISDQFNDSDTLFTDYILPGQSKVSTEAKVNILFPKSGLQSVQITNKFASEPTDGPVSATQQGGEWVIDTTYMIDVFAHILPAFRVLKDGIEVVSVTANEIPNMKNASSWPVVEVEAGQSLTFEDQTTVGRPNERFWNFEGSVPISSREASATVNYFSLGTYVGGGMNSMRNADRPAQEVSRIIPIQVKVIPSTLPFLFEGNLIEQEDEIIRFNVGGELQAFSGREGDFSVLVKNGESGFDEEIAVSLANVSDDDATAIELKLAAPIYNTDEISISYSGTEIKSADFRTLSAFGPELVAMHYVDNVIQTDWSGFETSDENWKKGFCFGFWVGNSNVNADMPIFSRTEEMAATGTASMKVDLYNGVENKTLQGTDFKTFSLEPGPYLLSMMVYLAPGNTLTTLQTVVQTPNTLIEWDITDTPRGEWVEISQRASFDIAPTKRYDLKIVASLNPATTEAQVLFVDDYSFIPLEAR